MAKPATQPDPFPPTKIEPPEPPPVVAVEESRLPVGVEMHDAARPPQPLSYHDRAIDTRVRRDPPPGWQGTYARCGDCGDFLPVPGQSCERCSPPASAPPQNMMIATPTKASAR